MRLIIAIIVLSCIQPFMHCSAQSRKTITALCCFTDTTTDDDDNTRVLAPREPLIDLKRRRTDTPPPLTDHHKIQPDPVPMLREIPMPPKLRLPPARATKLDFAQQIMVNAYEYAINLYSQILPSPHAQSIATNLYAMYTIDTRFNPFEKRIIFISNTLNRNRQPHIRIEQIPGVNFCLSFYDTLESPDYRNTPFPALLRYLQEQPDKTRPIVMHTGNASKYFHCEFQSMQPLIVHCVLKKTSEPQTS